MPAISKKKLSLLLAYLQQRRSKPTDNTMRETNFIQQNKEKWGKFEKVVSSDKTDPEELSNLFLEVTDDLSYARTFYPNRSVRVYLNGIAQKIFYSIYRNKRGGVGRFLSFWAKEVPQILYESRKELFFSLIVFLLAVGIGVLSTIMDVDFPRVILGDEYVNRTMENIEAGRPMSVYSSGDSSDMFFQIALNNLRVACLAFLVGLLFGVGTVYLLLFNGIMVGAFQMLFIQQGIYWESILTIWSHGTIEIACIIIAGGAGLTLGKGLVFPSTYSRVQSLQLAARRGILIMATIAPLIVLAAFIEGFFTGSSASMATRMVVVGVSLGFVLLYFVAFPYLRAQRDKVSYLRDAILPSVREEATNLHEIKGVSKIFSDTFTIFKNNIGTIVMLSGLIAAIYAIVLMQFNYRLKLGQSLFLIDGIDKAIENLGQFIFPYDIFDPLWWLNVMGFGAMGIFSVYQIHKLVRIQTINPKEDISKIEAQAKPKKINYFVLLLVPAAGAFFFNLILNTHPFFVFLAMLSAFPLLMMWQASSVADGKDPISAITKTLSLGFGNYMSMLGIFGVTMLMLFIFLLLGTAPVTGLFSSVVTTFIPMSQSLMRGAQEAFFIFINAFILFFTLPIVFIGMATAYFSFRETREANDLHAKISEIGVKRKSYGMERE
jgi:uncharacterized membrane protein SpoIIM required for sporulation